MAKTATIQDIIREAKVYLPHLNEERLSKAYEFAKEAHKGQMRMSGAAYIQHPLESTKILLSLRPDEDSMVACMLHDVLEDTPVSMETIEKEFGPSVMPLVLGMMKLGKVHYHGQERQIENLRKMFLSMSKDIRVVLIKLADRLHNMRTIEYIAEDKRKRIAEETLMIYIPIATRLGIYHMKNELEDLCFKVLAPQEYKRITGELAELTKIQEAIVRTCKKNLGRVLAEEGIEAIFHGRIKHPYSIYRKLRRKNKNYVNELHDVVAMRIIVKDEPTCYRVLGVVHKHWTPLSHRFKDYIAVPKGNGYQSLHTTLVGFCPKITNQPVEVQIRTTAMDQAAEIGIAAHWQYEEVGGRSIAVPDDKLRWVQSLVNLHETLKNNEEFVESLNVDIFKDRIFVLTPEGDVRDLPVNATPVDFAYAIHTEVGNRCKAAKVNGKIVPLDYALKNGEIVEIITANVDSPNRYWLSFVVTAGAKNKIKAWLNSQNKESTVQLGKELINAQLKRFNLPLLDNSYSILKEYEGRKLSLSEREEMIEKIGNGSVNVVTVIKKLFPEERLMKKSSKEDLAKHVLPENIQLDVDSQVLITGEKGYTTQIATCCMPSVHDEIIGYVTRGRGVTIHRKNCKVLKGNEKQRLVKASWASKDVSEYVVKLCLERRSRVGLLRDVADLFASNNLPIIDIENVKEEHSDTGKMLITVSVKDLDMLNFLIDHLEQIPGIMSVYEVD
ncbi:bifunctional (p)ppGpp synthetase/guanosine-3',5'-bis(diphosphate) 3'-pyrophosphohydrolase [Candidatus Peregrinibacteria bacterium]|nr:bifunctional (p)ppGpp synthetase/guanosine-3',5'-bis(diphosphate) 3'-pyrophosphohydrolase [Candidatus Peregrinibacteria bacterium]